MKASLKTVPRVADQSFVCERRTHSSTPFHWHYHPEFELILILEGRGKRFVGDSAHDYRAGDLVLMGPNLPHTYCPKTRSATGPQEQAHIVIQFRESFCGKAFFDTPEMRDVKSLLDRSKSGLTFRGVIRKRTADQIDALPEMEPGPRLVALLSILQSLAGQGKPLASSGFNPQIRPAEDRTIDLVCRHLEEHATQQIRQVDIAKLANMSPSAFSRFFKRETGRTMTDFLTELRIGLACRMLMETRLSVTEVCYRAGFNNYSNFVHHFQKRKSVTPSRFRDSYASFGRYADDRT